MHCVQDGTERKPHLDLLPAHAQLVALADAGAGKLERRRFDEAALNSVRAASIRLANSLPSGSFITAARPRTIKNAAHQLVSG